MFYLKAPSPTFLGTLQTVARVATENWKLQVKWNNAKKSFTDCRTEIQLGWSTDWIMEGCSNLAEWTAAMKGVLEHEIAHMLFSRTYEVRGSEIVPLFVLEDYYKKLGVEGMPKNISQFIQNALEDGRVNRLHVNMSPTMIQTLRWIVNLIYNDANRAMKDETNPLAWALNSLLGRVLVGKDLEGVPDDTVQFLDSIQSLIEEGLHAESSSDMITKAALPIGEAFIDEFPSMFAPAHLIFRLEHGEHRPLEESGKVSNVPDRGLDVRVKPKPKKHSKPEMIEETNSREEAKEPVSSTEENTESVEVPLETISSSSEGMDEEGEANESLEPTRPEDKSPPENVEGDSNTEEIEDSDEGLREQLDANETDLVEEVEPDDLSEERTESEHEDELLGVEDQDQGLEDLDQDTDEELSNNEDVSSLEGGTDDGMNDLEDECSISTSESGGLSLAEDMLSPDRPFLDDTFEKQPTEEEADEASRNLAEVDSSNEEPEETDFTELISKSAEEASEFKAKDESLERELRSAREEMNRYEVSDLRAFSVGHHVRVSFKEEQAPERAEWADLYKHERNDVESLIDEASDALYEYLVRQRHSAQRNLRSGRLDPRRLWRASGLMDGRIFMQRESPSNSTDVAIYLLLDMSGSMDIDNRYRHARKAAIILVEMLEAFGVAHTVVAFTGDMRGMGSVEHYRLVNWGEAEKHRLMFYHAYCNNRDGYSLRIASEELSKRPERAKVILMLSDGEPYADNYHISYDFDKTDSVMNDVAAEVDEATEKKVEVLHLYFGNTDENTLKKVAFMYPKLSVITNPADVPGAVADIVVSTLRKYM